MRVRSLVVLLALAAPVALPAAAAFEVVNFDFPGEGFNDPTPASPVGGNPGVTVGEQRQRVFDAAANIWGATLTSTQTIRVAALFESLACTDSSAVLGGASPFWSYADQPGLQAQTWYAAALAEKLSNADLGADMIVNYEIVAAFNSDIGQAGCLTGASWYYGLDGAAPSGQVDLLTVVLHEFGHGLGFTVGPTVPSLGLRLVYPSVWEQFVRDLTSGKAWNTMNGLELIFSSLNTNNLVWTGPNVQVDLQSVLGFRTELLVQGPFQLRDFEALPASFGPTLDQTGLQGRLTLPTDSGGVSPTDACEPIVSPLQGRIALVDRGTCSYVQKVLNAQAAGAIGVVIVNNDPNGIPAITGASGSVTIPSIGVAQLWGGILKLLPPVNDPNAQGLEATLRLSPSVRQGTSGGYPRLYAPNPYEQGSSVVHWDTSLFPNQLMEPFINRDLTLQVTPPADLTTSLLRDIGW